MFRGYRVIAALVMFVTLSACSVTHPIAKDYPQYLGNNSTASIGSTKLETGYVLTPATQGHHYEFRAMMTGAANLWVVEFGQMLDQTLQSAEVQRAFGKLIKGADVDGNNLIFNLEKYEFDDFAAHIELRVTYHHAGQDVFNKSYHAVGKSQGGKMFIAGAFGMKNAIQQSTKLALDQILGDLIVDLNANASR